MAPARTVNPMIPALWVVLLAAATPDFDSDRPRRAGGGRHRKPAVPRRRRRQAGPDRRRRRAGGQDRHPNIDIIHLKISEHTLWKQMPRLVAQIQAARDQGM